MCEQALCKQDHCLAEMQRPKGTHAKNIGRQVMPTRSFVLSVLGHPDIQT